MIAHVIENGIIVNTIVVESLDFMPGLVEATEGGIGWSDADGVFTPPVVPAPTQEEIALAMERAIDAHIDSVAQAKGYDSRITATLRAGYSNPWQAEGIAFGQWMDSVYAYCQQVQVDALAGNRTIPTIEELIAELPEMVWP